MRTTWERWDLDDMTGAAEVEGLRDLRTVRSPEVNLVGALPYFGAFSEYREHVTCCPDCLFDDRPDCAEGTALAAVARIGMEEQHLIAASN
jgi:hypothetical protein